MLRQEFSKKNYGKIFSFLLNESYTSKRYYVRKILIKGIILYIECIHSLNFHSLLQKSVIFSLS